MRFAEAPPAITELPEQSLMQQLMAFTKADLLRGAELVVIALLTLMVLMVVVRPLVKQMLAPEPGALRQIPSFARNGALIVDESGAQDEPGAFGAVSGTGGPVGIPMEAPSERMLAVAQIKGQLKAQSVEKIGALVSQNPADTVAVLRGWIHEKAAA